MINGNGNSRRYNMPNSASKSIAALFLLTASSLASAHSGHDVSGFAAGLEHPFSGFDHLLAMVAVGLWAAQSGGRRIWQLPAIFMAMLAAGAGFSMQWQHSLPLIETGIAASVLALGLLIALSLQLPTWQSLVLTGLFGLLHGYAHGQELPESTIPLAYALGFLAATTALHLGGIATVVASKNRYTVLAKIAGYMIAASGVGFLTFS
jgi:urease accessory protein